MKAKITIPIMIKPEPEVFPKAVSEESFKTCPYCGQNRIPFKKGICICRAQVGDIVYVKDAKKFAKGHYYTYIGTPKVEKLGIAELMDN